MVPLACTATLCQNSGTCSLVNGLPICACPIGFTGAQCQTGIFREQKTISILFKLFSFN